MEQVKKRCPFCAEEILADARKCKHCGEYLDDSLKEKNSSKQTTVVAKEGCFLQTMNAGCMVILVIVIVIVLMFIFGSLSRCT